MTINMEIIDAGIGYMDSNTEYQKFVDVFEPNFADFLQQAEKRYYKHSHCLPMVISMRTKDNFVILIPQSKHICSKSGANACYREMKKNLEEHITDEYRAKHTYVHFLVDTLHDEILAVNGNPLPGLFSWYPPNCNKESDRVIYHYKNKHGKPQFASYLQMLGYSNLAILELKNSYLPKAEKDTPCEHTIMWLLDLISHTYGFPPIENMFGIRAAAKLLTGNSTFELPKQPTGELKRYLHLRSLPIEILDYSETEVEEDYSYATRLSEIIDKGLIPRNGDIIIDLPISGKVIAATGNNGDLIFSAHTGLTQEALAEQLGFDNFTISYLLM